MNNEFKRMQQLAGIKEIKIKPSGVYQRILDEYVKGVLDTQETWEDDPEALEYINSLKQNPPRADTADDAAREIQKIDDTSTEFVGQYKGDFYDEAVVDPLIDLGKKTPFFKPSIKEILEILHGLYDLDPITIQQYEDTLSDQWRDDRIYQDILSKFISNIYRENQEKSMWVQSTELQLFVRVLYNLKLKANTMEELASALVTIDDKILELGTDEEELDEFSYRGLDGELNKILSSHPEYESVIHSLLDDDGLYGNSSYKNAPEVVKAYSIYQSARRK
jgi:hypothetical protein